MKTRLIVCLLLGLLLGQSIKAQNFTLTNPVAGQTYIGQTVMRAQWTTPRTDIIQIFFWLSADGGVTTAYAATANFFTQNTNGVGYYDPGYFDIALPNVPSNNYRLYMEIVTTPNGDVFYDTSDVFTILPFAAPTLGVIMPTDTTICAQSNLQIVPQITGGTPPYQVTWTSAALQPYLLGNSDTLNFTDIYYYQSTNFQINVTVIDASGKTGIDSIQVHSHPLANFTYLPETPYAVCGSQDTTGLAYAGGAQVQSYQWYQLPDETTVVGDSAALMVLAQGNATNTYALFATDQYGCRISYDTVVITTHCNTLPILANNDCYQLGTPDSVAGGLDFFFLHILSNDVYDTTGNNYGFSMLTNPLTGGLVYHSWSSENTQIPYVTPNYLMLALPPNEVSIPDSFQYILTDYHSPNLYDTGWVRINTGCPVNLGQVWPGDTRDDGYVDNTSLLPIGVGYGSTGPVRAGATISWTGQNCSDWTDSLATGSNYKYIDCNGDGTINADDTMAIHNNFFLVHARGGGPQSSSASAPVLSVSPVEDTVFNGDTLHAVITLGDSSVPASNVYGVAFDIQVDPLVVDTHYVAIKYTNSWLGNTADELTLSKYFADQGLIKTAVTRYDNVGRSGYGVIATVDFLITTSNVNGKNTEYYQAMLNTASILMLDSVGTPLPINSAATSTRVNFYQTTLSTQQLQADNAIKVFPNPANTQIFITSRQARITAVRILDMLGQQVAIYNPNSNLLQADVSQLANGIYIAEIEASTGKTSKRIVIAK